MLLFYLLGFDLLTRYRNPAEGHGMNNRPHLVAILYFAAIGLALVWGLAGWR